MNVNTIVYVIAGVIPLIIISVCICCLLKRKCSCCNKKVDEDVQDLTATNSTSQIEQSVDTTNQSLTPQFKGQPVKQKGVTLKVQPLPRNHQTQKQPIQTLDVKMHCQNINNSSMQPKGKLNEIDQSLQSKFNAQTIIDLQKKIQLLQQNVNKFSQDNSVSKKELNKSEMSITDFKDESDQIMFSENELVIQPNQKITIPQYPKIPNPQMQNHLTFGRAQLIVQQLTRPSEPLFDQPIFSDLEDPNHQPDNYANQVVKEDNEEDENPIDQIKADFTQFDDFYQYRAKKNAINQIQVNVNGQNQYQSNYSH